MGKPCSSLPTWPRYLAGLFLRRALCNRGYGAVWVAVTRISAIPLDELGPAPRRGFFMRVLRVCNQLWYSLGGFAGCRISASPHALFVRAPLGCLQPNGAAGLSGGGRTSPSTAAQGRRHHHQVGKIGHDLVSKKHDGRRQDDGYR